MQLRWKIHLASLALFWEQLWPALIKPLCVAGLYGLLALVGVTALLPYYGQAVLLAGFAVALLWALRELFQIRWPDQEAALRRLERTADLPHRPATSYFDTLNATIGDDPAAASLWAAHRARLGQLLARLRAGWPKPDLAARDPYALRAALLVALVAAVALTGRQAPEKIEDAIKLSSRTAADTLWLDAWVTPPAYTGKAPIFLTTSKASGSSATAAGGSRERIAARHTVPENSELTVRVTGGGTPSLALVPLQTNGAKDGPKDIAAGKTRGQMREWRIPLKASAEAHVREGSRQVRSWTFDIVPDKVPEIAFVQLPGASVRDALEFTYSARDDYGIASAEAEIGLAKAGTAQKGEAKRPRRSLPIDPPNFALTLPNLRPKVVEQKIFQDLTSHPWAGLAVEVTLVARDEAGQIGRSQPVVTKLPARRFEKPLARALVEQRRTLILDADRRLDVALALHALTLFPERFIKKSSVHLGLRTAYFRLTRASDDKAMLEAADLLWDIALYIEDGDISDAERELRAAQRALQKALAEGASEQEIAKAMDRLRQAMNRYMSALARQMREAMRRGELQPQQGDMRSIKPQDLSKMLDSIEDLIRQGARSAAQQMLSQLQNLLENMRTGMQMQGGQQQSEMSKMLRELGSLIGKQRQLMDDTYQADRGIGRDGKQGLSEQEGSNLAQQQESLRQMLDRMMRQMGRNGPKTPGAFGRAGEAMREAERRLREGQGRGAVGRQGEAIDQLRQGAQSLAQQMLEGMAQRAGQNRQGRTGPRGKTDPLGRPMRSSGPDQGLSTKVPEEFAIERAREIMRELRRRLGDQFRPRIELDYLERLLRQF